MLDDKDTFSKKDGGEYPLKRFLWEQIKGHHRAEPLNWREMAERLRELAYDAEMEADKEHAQEQAALDPDEITPEDLPHAP